MQQGTDCGKAPVGATKGNRNSKLQLTIVISRFALLCLKCVIVVGKQSVLERYLVKQNKK